MRVASKGQLLLWYCSSLAETQADWASHPNFPTQFFGVQKNESRIIEAVAPAESRFRRVPPPAIQNWSLDPNVFTRSRGASHHSSQNTIAYGLRTLVKFVA